MVTADAKVSNIARIDICISNREVDIAENENLSSRHPVHQVLSFQSTRKAGPTCSCLATRSLALI